MATKIINPILVIDCEFGTVLEFSDVVPHRKADRLQLADHIQTFESDGKIPTLGKGFAVDYDDSFERGKKRIIAGVERAVEKWGTTHIIDFDIYPETGMVSVAQYLVDTMAHKDPGLDW